MRIHQLAVQRCHEQSYSFREIPKLETADRVQYLGSSIGLVSIVAMSLFLQTHYYCHYLFWFGKMSLTFNTSGAIPVGGGSGGGARVFEASPVHHLQQTATFHHPSASSSSSAEKIIIRGSPTVATVRTTANPVRVINVVSYRGEITSDRD